MDRQASVAVQPSWAVTDEIAFPKLVKQRVDTLPSEEDLLWCGFLDHYNDAYERVTSTNTVPLKRIENKEFYPVTTTDGKCCLKIEAFAQLSYSGLTIFHVCRSCN